MGINITVLQGFYDLLNAQTEVDRPLSSINKIYRSETIDHVDNPLFPCISIGDFEDVIEGSSSGMFDFSCQMLVSVFTQIDITSDNPLYGENKNVIYLSEGVINTLHTNSSLSNLGVGMVRAHSSGRAIIEGEVAQKQITVTFELKGVSNR